MECGGTLVLLEIHFLNLWVFQQTTNPIKIQIPIPAPDKGGLVACVSGPVYTALQYKFNFSTKRIHMEASADTSLRLKRH